MNLFLTLSLISMFLNLTSDFFSVSYPKDYLFAHVIKGFINNVAEKIAVADEGNYRRERHEERRDATK